MTLLCLCFHQLGNPHATAEIRDLPVPVSTIYPHVLITADLIVGRKFRTTASSVQGIATDVSELIGKEARRRLVAGRPIPLGALQISVTVKRGEKVLALFKDDGLTISAAMIALQDGVVGDEIDVRNPVTGITVRAAVQSDRSLRVGEP